MELVSPAQAERVSALSGLSTVILAQGTIGTIVFMRCFLIITMAKKMKSVLWDIYTMGFYPDINNQIVQFAGKLMKLENYSKQGSPS